MNSVVKTIKGFDIYHIPITFTYKGEKSFNSFAGGVVSIIVVFGLIAFCGERLHD